MPPAPDPLPSPARTAGPVPVSVVIPCFNAAATIARTLESVRAQGQTGTQVIVVDDGSTDGSAAAARRADPAAEVLEGPNRGACHARNRGLAAARGTFVLFLDADDAIRGDVLAAGAALAEAAAADIVFTPILRVAPGGGAVRQDRIPPGITAPDLFEAWLRGAQVNPAGVLWRRSFVTAIGGWDERVLINQDAEIVLRGLIAGARIAVNPAGEGIYHVGNPDSLSGRKSEAKLANYVETLGRLLALAEGTPCAGRCGGIEDTLYGVARMAFRAGWPAPGRQALAILQARGALHHRGSLAHRLVAGLVGLEAKVRLWGR